MIREAPPRSKDRRAIGLVIMGELERRHRSEEPWAPVDSGTSIFLDDAVRTGPAAKGSIVFLDGSVSHLLPNSQVQYHGAAHGKIGRPSLVSLTRGEVWHVVEKGGPTFTVLTRTAQAIVHGTEFGVAVDARGKTRLEVKTGKVEFRAAHGAVMVAAGMESAALPGQGPALPLPVSPPVRTASGKRGHPGTLRSVPLPGEAKARPAKDPGARPLHPSSSPAAPAPVEESSPPSEPPGSPSTSGDDGTDSQRPFSTSR
jgi:hypothetical protein